ncbi:MAG: hypothetical protein JXQ90_22710 [Cyclobacteriaceae bacterium]
MRYFLCMLVVGLLGCGGLNPDDERRSSEYLLHRAGQAPVRGLVTFTEMEPGKIQVLIELENTDERYAFPAHLHFGSITEVGELAIRLEDVEGASGRSVTILDQEVIGEEVFTFDMLSEMNGSVKIHLSEGLFGHVVLSYGNIGANENLLSDGMTMCTGH